MRINWKRLLWVVFIACYTTLFFLNFFKPFNNWVFVYIYTMLLVFWLCTQYYQRHVFFQSGLLFDYHWAIRFIFALFFYSSFVIGLSTIVWWRSNRIGLYPYVNIIGITVLAIAIYMRRKFYVQKAYHQESIEKFYFTMYLLLASLALGYGSIFLVIYTVIIGFPLVYVQTIYEKRNFSKYEPMIRSAKTYSKLQKKYLEIVQEQHAEKKKRGKK